MDDFTKIITAILGLTAVIAIVSVVVSKRSQAPQAIQAIASGVSSIVAAAVNPVSASYGYGNGAQAATAPAGGILSGIGLSDLGIPSIASSIIPGGSK